MKNKIFVVLVFLSLFMLAACSPSAKRFSGVGISIELDDSFVSKEVLQAPFYLESQNHMFAGMRESKTELAMYSVYNPEA